MDTWMSSITEAELKARIVAGETGEELGPAGFLCQAGWFRLSLLKKT